MKVAEARQLTWNIDDHYQVLKQVKIGQPTRLREWGTEQGIPSFTVDRRPIRECFWRLFTGGWHALHGVRPGRRDHSEILRSRSFYAPTHYPSVSRSVPKLAVTSCWLIEALE